MRAELLAELCAVARGEHAAKSPVTHATPVTLQPGYSSRAPGLQALQRLQAKRSNGGKRNSSPVTAPATIPPGSDEATVEERAGLAADSVPLVYLDAWASLNYEKPLHVSEAEWRLALDDGGRFLDAWGNEAADIGWTPGDLFRPRTGLLWHLTGLSVKAIGQHHIRLSDGRTIQRAEMRGARDGASA